MRSPFGDQTGARLIETSVVKRCSAPRARSRSQRSALSLAKEVRRNTIDFSSGEIAGSQTGPAVPIVSRDFPPRSYQSIWLFLPTPLLSYKSTPVSDTVTGA